MASDTTSAPAASRTATDYALEFAEYLARGAEHLIEAVCADAEVRLRIAESDDVDDDTEHDAQASVDEALRSLRDRIGQFRSRRDRAARAALAAPAAQEAEPAVPWTPGPNLFKDWCAQWFGPDSDEDYLAKAVFALPSMAQRFAQPAHPPLPQADAGAAFGRLPAGATAADAVRYAKSFGAREVPAYGNKDNPLLLYPADLARMLAAAPQAPAEAVVPAAAPTQEADGWMPIETAPKDGRVLLLGYYNAHGNWRTLRGEWVSADQIAEYWDEEAEPGWYETSVEAEDPPNAWATNPTHWRPLPAPAARARQEGGGA